MPSLLKEFLFLLTPHSSLHVDDMKYLHLSHCDISRTYSLARYELRGSSRLAGAVLVHRLCSFCIHQMNGTKAK